jgi:RNA polymerase sigma-70 factor (ECF subfamily)
MTGPGVVEQQDASPRAAPTESSPRADAFRRLAQVHLDSSYRLACAILGNPAEAEDATHDAFVMAWQQWPNLRNPLLFERWFDRILVNTCRNRLRRTTRFQMRDLAEEHDLQRPDPAIAAVDDRHLVGSAIRRLGPDDRVVLALRFYRDLSVDEIAGRLGIRPGTVKSRLHYAMRRMHDALDDPGTREAGR